MFNLKKVAEEVFGILRSFNYEVAMFDEEGAQSYDPAVSVRFFTNRNNITVSINDTGENSSVRLLLGRSVDLASVRGLIDTMRNKVGEFGLSWNVRKYNRELSPKDFSNGMISEGRSLSGSTKSSYLKLEGARMIIRHAETVDDSKQGARARNVKKVMVENADGERLLMPSNNLGAGRAMTRHVSKGGHWNDDNGQKIVEMAKQQRDLRACASHCRKNARKIEEAATLVEACIGKVRGYRDIFEGLYRNYDKNIKALPDTNDVVLNEDDEDFDERVDALSERLQLDEDSVMDREACKTVTRVLGDKTPLKEKTADMVALPALDVQVERAPWEAFKNEQKLNLKGRFEKKGDEAQMVSTISDLVVEPGMAAMFSHVADRMMNGDGSALLSTIASKAIAAVCGLLDEEDETVETPNDQEVSEDAEEENVAMRETKFGKVETQAWDDLKAGKIALSGGVNLSAGHQANLTQNLRLVAEKAVAKGLGELLKRVADDMDVGRGTDLHQSIAMKAVQAAVNAPVVSESTIIATKAIREFDQWFAAFSPEAISEGMGIAMGYDDDSYADAINSGLDTAAANYNMEDYLVMHGDDFGYGNNDIDNEVTGPMLLSSLSSYLSDQTTSSMDDAMVGSGSEVGTEELARKLLPDLINKLETEGYTVTDQEALEGDDSGEDDVDPALLPDQDVLDETDEEAVDGEDGLDDNHELLLDDSDELSSEDLLLPKNPARDFAKDVKADKKAEDDDENNDDINRMLSLAGIKKS